MVRHSLVIAGVALCCTNVLGQFQGGIHDGHATGGTVQSVCIPAALDLTTSGGINGGHARTSVQQSSCALDQYDFLFAGGANDGSSASVLAQTLCPTPEFERLFRGGNNDGAASLPLIQEDCPAPTTHQLFYGGNADGASNAASLQQVCDEPMPMVIWRGGLYDGQGKGINEQTLCPGITPLPIELVRWEAECLTDMVLLHWTTASEYDNDFFSIERSTDAEQWEVLEHVPSGGNSVVLRDYAYADLLDTQGLRYYRLAQTDLDGTMTRSAAIVVDCTKRTNELLAYPNPNNGTFTLQAGPNSSIEEIHVLSSTGRLVRTLPWTGDIMHVDLPGLASGVYVIRAVSTDRIAQLRVVIER